MGWPSAAWPSRNGLGSDLAGRTPRDTRNTAPTSRAHLISAARERKAAHITSLTRRGMQARGKNIHSAVGLKLFRPPSFLHPCFFFLISPGHTRTVRLNHRKGKTIFHVCCENISRLSPLTTSSRKLVLRIGIDNGVEHFTMAGFCPRDPDAMLAHRRWLLRLCNCSTQGINPRHVEADHGIGNAGMISVPLSCLCFFGRH